MGIKFDPTIDGAEDFFVPHADKMGSFCKKRVARSLDVNRFEICVDMNIHRIKPRGLSIQNGVYAYLPRDSLSKAQFNVPIYPDSHACGTFHNVYSRLSRKSLGFTNIFLIPTKG